jgi:hypothetical protein
MQCTRSVGPSADVMENIRVLRVKVPARCCRASDAGVAFELYWVSRAMRAMCSKFDGWGFDEVGLRRNARDCTCTSLWKERKFKAAIFTVSA